MLSDTVYSATPRASTSAHEKIPALPVRRGCVGVGREVGVVERQEELERGREASRRRAWADAYRSLALADHWTPLGPEDLELLARAAYLRALDDACLQALERAHRAYLDSGDPAGAARCAFWLGFRLVALGEAGRATGWLARARRALERVGRECVEHGYLLLPLALQQLATGDPGEAAATAVRAAEIGERFGEADLAAYGRHLQGRALLELGRVDEGLALLDEAMVAVVAGELSPLVTGLIYCSVIAGCRQIYELRRAHEWTAALTRWCEAQPDLVTYTGSCLVHRAENLLLRGAWPDAIAEARRATALADQGADRDAAAGAFYLQGEGSRLLGRFEEADDAYRRASLAGAEPHPGLALLRLWQGRTDVAAGAIRRVLGETPGRAERATLLSAATEILLAAGDGDGAGEACRELEEIADQRHALMLTAMAAHARGAVALAGGDPRAALEALRRAERAWRELEAPYEVARVCVSVALACRALGDADSASLELEAARTVFDRLGAAPDLARVDALLPPAPARHAGGLTPRELQVLRLVAAGKTNRAIAAELLLSEKTVERHVSSILTKLDVSSRAGATAYAYTHRLV
jgi:DNA-binding NarL/FixJ family response regulator